MANNYLKLYTRLARERRTRARLFVPYAQTHHHGDPVESDSGAGDGGRIAVTLMGVHDVGPIVILQRTPPGRICGPHVRRIVSSYPRALRCGRPRLMHRSPPRSQDRGGLFSFPPARGSASRDRSLTSEAHDGTRLRCIL